MKVDVYKGFRIRKRSGMDMKRRAVTGYSAYNPLLGQQNFRTLAEAKAWVDSKVEKEQS
jgi:hypothetical protein